MGGRSMKDVGAAVLGGSTPPFLVGSGRPSMLKTKSTAQTPWTRSPAPLAPQAGHLHPARVLTSAGFRRSRGTLNQVTTTFRIFESEEARSRYRMTRCTGTFVKLCLVCEALPPEERTRQKLPINQRLLLGTLNQVTTTFRNFESVEARSRSAGSRYRMF